MITEDTLSYTEYTDLPSGNETVLLVEDEESLLEIVKLMLEELGYEVLTACRPFEAIQLAVEHPGRINLLATDVVMPEMSGSDLAQQISDLRPGIKCLFISGYPANIVTHHGVPDEGDHFLQKPFQIEVMAAKVRKVIDKA